MSQAPLPSPLLTTPRIHIRPYHQQDGPSIAHNASPLAIAKYMARSFPHPYTLASAEQWINMNLSPTTHFAITLSTAPETVIGSIGLKPQADVEAETAELGYWLGEEYWGRGLMKEAVKVFTDWGFGVRGEREKEGDEQGWRFRKVTARVLGGNMASLRVLESCGYVVEGRLREQARLRTGECVDVTLLGLTRSMWERGATEGKE